MLTSIVPVGMVSDSAKVQDAWELVVTKQKANTQSNQPATACEVPSRMSGDKEYIETTVGLVLVPMWQARGRGSEV